MVHLNLIGETYKCEAASILQFEQRITCLLQYNSTTIKSITSLQTTFLSKIDLVKDTSKPCYFILCYPLCMRRTSTYFVPSNSLKSLHPPLNHCPSLHYFTKSHQTLMKHLGKYSHVMAWVQL